MPSALFRRFGNSGKASVEVPGRRTRPGGLTLRPSGQAGLAGVIGHKHRAKIPGAAQHARGHHDR